VSSFFKVYTTKFYFWNSFDPLKIQSYHIMYAMQVAVRATMLIDDRSMNAVPKLIFYRWCLICRQVREHVSL